MHVYDSVQMSENYFKRARKSRADCLLGVEIVRRETRIVNLRLDAFFRLDALLDAFFRFLDAFFRFLDAFLRLDAVPRLDALLVVSRARFVALSGVMHAANASLRFPWLFGVHPQ
jgi:hypothetical protein